ncbi:MAG TPA: hypothetical protein ENJ79_03310 [Gammaproteobacteria bacterium]|nr:hypothetical protein [Gammaproteobacteria bacterium]
MKHVLRPILILAATLVSPLAQAHDNGLSSGLLAGLVHPLTGLDHLAALILAGFLVGRLKRGEWLALGALIGALGAGAMGGALLGTQAGVENLILLSLPVLLGFQWLRGRVPVRLAVAVTGLFMLAHGWAHGVEVQGNTLAFFIGFLLTSTVIAGVGARVCRYLSMPGPHFSPAS